MLILRTAVLRVVLFLSGPLALTMVGGMLVPTVAALAGQASDRSSDSGRFPALRHFMAANNVPSPAFARYGLGWGRHDFSWGAIEPRRGEFVWDDYDAIVLKAHASGREVLPMLGYTAAWANAAQDGFAPPDRVADWERFVERTVARYSRPPFNLRYFQVWNEPTRKAGFWHGASEEEWVDKIYLPAARIIRRLGCCVVFGGWPISEPERLDHFLRYHDAWRYTDIIDVHYFEMGSWQALYDQWIATGRCRGLWQTEIGYLTFPNYLPNAYLRGLYWALKHDWSFPEKYKLFWFAFWGAGPDAPRCLTGPDGFVSEHGQRAAVMRRLLGSGRLQAFDDYTLDPPLGFALHEETSAAMGFQCGKRRVIALCVDPATQARHPVMRLRLQRPVPGAGAQLVEVTGGTTALPFADAERRTIEVPIGQVASQTARDYGRPVNFAIGYVVVR